MNEEILQKLHANLTQKVKGFNVPYDQFVSDMQDPEKRRKLHANMPKFFNGFNKSFEEFSTDLGDIQAQEIAPTAITPDPTTAAPVEQDKPWYKGAVDLAKSAYSGAVDMIPQMGATYINQEIGKIQDPMKAFMTEAGEGQLSTTSFARTLGATFFNKITDALYGEGAANTVQSDTRLSLDKYSEEQKKDAQERLKGVVQDYREIGDFNDFTSFVGNALGQAISQIPLSVATRGASSVIMENAIAYDQQLDALAKQHGISREEVIARNLDNAASGQIFTNLSAGLDAVSAGVIMKVLRKSGAKEMAEGALTRFFKGFLGEGTTESLQGIGEDAAAAMGSGTKLELDPSKSLNEFLAGGFGGGPMNVIVPSSKEDRASRDKQIDIDTQLEDKALQAQIDEAVKGSADLVTKALDGLEGVKNLKAQDMIRAAQDAVIEAKQAQARAESEAREAIFNEDRVRAAAELLAQFEASPVVTAPYEEAEQEDITKLPAIQERVAPTVESTPVTTTSVVAPEPVTTPASQPVAIAKTPKKAIKKVEKPSTPKKITPSFKENLQTMSTEAIQDEFQTLLQKQDEAIELETELSPVENAKLEILGAELKVREASTAKQAEKALVQKEKELEKHASKAVALKGSVVKIQKVVKSASVDRLEGVIKKATKAYEDTQYEPYLEVAKEAAKAQEALQNKIEDRKAAAEESKALAEERKKNVKTKEERLAEKEEKKTVREAKKAASSENKEVSVKPYPKLKGFEKEQTGKLGAIKERFYTEIARAQELGLGERAINDAVEAYIDFRESNNLPMEVGGKPLTPEIIRQKASTRRGVIAKETKKKKEEARKDEEKAKQMGLSVKEFQRIKKDVQMAEAKGISLADYQKLPPGERVVEQNKEQIKELKKAMANELGIKSSDLDDINFDFTDFIVKGTKYVSNYLGTVLKNFDKKKLTYVKNENLAKMIQDLPNDFRLKYSLELLKQIESTLKKRGSKLNVFVYKSEYPFGAYIDAKNMDILILSSASLEPASQTKYTHGIVLHELMHGKTNMLAHALYKLNKTFASRVNDLYDRTKGKLYKITEDFIREEVAKYRKLEDKSKYFLINSINMQDEKTPIRRLFKYIRDFSADTLSYTMDVRQLEASIKELAEINDKDPDFKDYLKLAQNRLLSEDVTYALKNQREFLSEGTSSTTFAALLHSLPSNTTASGLVEKGKSILRALFQELRVAVENLVGKKENRTAFDELEELLTTYDDLFDEEADVNWDPNFLVPTVTELIRVQGYTGEQAFEKREAQLKSAIREANEQINERKASPKNPESGAYKKIVKGISSLLETNTLIDSQAKVQEFVDRVNKKLDTHHQLGEGFTKDIWKQIKRDRKSLANDLKARDFYIKKLKEAEEYKDVTSKYHHDVNDFASVDLSTLNRNTRGILLTKGFSQLLNNAIVSRSAYNIVLNSRVTEVLKTLEQNQDKVNKSWFSKQTVKWSNPMTAITTISKYDKNLSDVLMKNLYEKLMWAYSQSGVKSDKFWKSLSVYAEKNNFNHANLAKIGLYGGIFSTESDPNNKEAWEKEVTKNAEIAVVNAKNKLQAKEEGTYNGDLSLEAIKQELAIALDVFAKVEKNPSMDKILSDKETGLYNMIRDFAKKNEMEFFRNAYAVWGQKPPIRFNYFPTLAQGRTDMKGLKNYADDEIIRSNADNVFDALNDDQKGTFNSVFGKKVGSVYRRLNPEKGYYYEFDALAIGKRWGKNLLFDTYASSELKIANRIFNSDVAKKTFGLPLRNSLIQQIRVSAGAGLRYDHNVSQFWKTVMKVRDFSYMSTMLTTGQLVLQTSSGLAAASIISSNINPVTAGKTFGKAANAASRAFNKDSKFYKLLEERGLGIQLRDAGFEKYLSPEDYRGWVKMGQWRKRAEKTSEWAITSADKFAARLVWFAAYFDAGGTMEKVNEEAVRKAERATGLLQGISDVRWTPENFAYDSLTKKLIFGSLYAYKRFSLNAWLSLVGSMRNLNNPEARTIAAAQFGSYMAYHAATLFITRPMWSWAIEQIKELAGEDDDEEDEEKRMSKWNELLYNVGWDAMIGSPAPASVDQALRYAVVNFGPAQKFWKDPYEDFDQYVDSPLYAPKDLQDAFYKNLIGPGLKEPVAFGLDGIDVMLMYSQADIYEDTEDDITERDFKTDQWFWNSLGDILGSIPLMPFRGDARKLIKEYYKDKKQDYMRDRRENSRGSGTNVDSEQLPESTDVQQYNDFVSDPDSYNSPENP